MTPIDYAQLAAPFFAAAMAAYWGVLRYRSQKRVDRAEAFHEEKRRVYHEFLVLAGDATNSIRYDAEEKLVRLDKKALDQVSSAVGVLNLYGSDEVIDTAMAFLKFLHLTNGKPVGDTDKPEITVRKIGEVMRRDLVSGSSLTT